MKQWLLQKRWRVLLAGFLTVALPLVGLTLYVYLQVIAEFEKIGLREIQTFFNLAVYHTEEKINDDISSGKIFASRPQLLEALQKGDRNSVGQNLKDLLQNLTNMERAAITNRRGIMLANYPEEPDVIGIDFSFRDWYRGVSKKWEPYVSDFFLIETKPTRYLFVIAVPIKDGSGEVAGVLVLQPGEDYLKNILAQMSIGNSFLYAVDKHGNLIYHPQYSLDRIIDFSKIPAVDKVKKGISGIEQNYDTMHKERIISAFRPMKWGWGIIMQRPAEEVFHHSGETALGLFLLAASFLVLGGITAYKGAGLLFSSHRLSLELQKKERHEREMKEMLRTELDEHLRTGQRLAETMAELERSNKELEQFAYVASHDLQEPLRKITNFIDLLKKRYEDEFDQEAAGYLRHVVEGSKRMQRLINDLLAYCRIDTRGKPFLQTDFNRVLVSVLSDLDKAIKSSRAEITHDPLPVLRADEMQMSQVFQNLIGNAIKFCRDAPPRIHIAARREVNGWIFSVSDNGIGIKMDFFDRIFVMFQRLHTQTEYPGTGIGLAVCKKIIERHGGNIWVESEVGKGTTFYFSIPEKSMVNK